VKRPADGRGVPATSHDGISFNGRPNATFSSGAAPMPGLQGAASLRPTASIFVSIHLPIE
jgi:hypothetical protein